MAIETLDLEGMYQSDMMIGLSSWIIADGNYPHFKRGRASFALALHPANSPFDIPRDWLSINPPDVDRASMCHIEGSEYLITAEVTHVRLDRVFSGATLGASIDGEPLYSIINQRLARRIRFRPCPWLQPNVPGASSSLDPTAPADDLRSRFPPDHNRGRPPAIE